MLTRLAKTLALGALVALSLPIVQATAETRVTLKAAKAGTSYYVMSVQIAEAAKAGTAGAMVVTVEESQGSVQNVKEAKRRTGNYVFTSPPSLIKGAMAGAKPFEGEADDFKDVRALFPLPALTMHWVVRADAGVNTLSDLAGKSFIPGGKGSFGERMTRTVFGALGIADKVKLVDVELNAAVPAVKNGQVAGFATAGSWPAPNVQELAATTAIQLVGLTPDETAKVLAADRAASPHVIPAGTYKGIDHDVRTVSLPVGAYATARMDEEAAYQLVKAFWKGREGMASQAAWWAGVREGDLGTLAGRLHPRDLTI